MMSGFDLARELLAIRPGLPILMTSGYVHPEDQKAAEDLGIRRIILKPSRLDVLAAALATSSNPSPSPRPISLPRLLSGNPDRWLRTGASRLIS
jgi:DNA-binding NarL/FixJ family response regulator